MNNRTLVHIIVYLAALGFVLRWLIGLYPSHPNLTIILGSSLSLILGWAALGDYRSKKSLDATQAELANTPCPSCGGLYGTEAAFDAIHPPPRPMIIDNFRIYRVKCPSCGDHLFFHSKTRN